MSAGKVNDVWEILAVFLDSVSGVYVFRIALSVGLDPPVIQGVGSENTLDPAWLVIYMVGSHSGIITGIRHGQYSSAFPAGVTIASTWDEDLAYARGFAMGVEHRGKGVDVQLGPVSGPLGLFPEGKSNRPCR